MDRYFERTIDVDGCWIWQGCLNSDGYPKVAYKGNCNTKLHRLIAEWHHKQDITGLVVRHKCDNPKCINPAHLLLGSNADNMRDRDERGRHGKALLTHKEVIEIRDLVHSGCFSNNEVAELYGVNHRTVSSIKLRKHWKHLN